MNTSRTIDRLRSAGTCDNGTLRANQNMRPTCKLYSILVPCHNTSNVNHKMAIKQYDTPHATSSVLVGGYISHC